MRCLRVRILFLLAFLAVSLADSVSRPAGHAGDIALLQRKARAVSKDCGSNGVFYEPNNIEITQLASQNSLFECLAEVLKSTGSGCLDVSAWPHMKHMVFFNNNTKFCGCRQGIKVYLSMVANQDGSSGFEEWKCDTPPTPSPTPPPTPSPTPPPTSSPTFSNRMSGDPHVWFNGTKKTLHLPTDRFTDLFEQASVGIHARGGPDDDTKMNYLFAVSVSVGGREVARIEQERGQLDKKDALMKLTSRSITSHVEHGHYRLSSFRVHAKRETVEFLHEPTGLQFIVSSRVTKRRDAKNSHHLNLRFGKGVKTTGVGSATGVLPQMWGTQQLTPDVQALIVGRSETKERRSLADKKDDGFHGINGVYVSSGVDGVDDVAFFPDGSDGHNGPDGVSITDSIDAARVSDDHSLETWGEVE